VIAGSNKGKLLVFSVFLLGIVSGVLMTTVWQTRLSSVSMAGDKKSVERANADRDVNSFYDYVGLTAAQRSQVTQIMKDSRPGFNKIFEQTRPQMQALQKQTRSQIRAILTEDQKKKYDEFNEARHSKQKPQPAHSQ
jgi:hypothetical protein